MQDVVYIIFMLALVGVTALFVIFCDKLIGPDETALKAESVHLDDEEAENEGVPA